MSEERRRAPRHPVAVEVKFASGTGVTRDVSGLGVLFDSAQKMEPGDDVSLTLVIPGSIDALCRGRVVRVSQENGRYLIAATVDRYALPEESARSTPPKSNLIHRELQQYHPEAWEWGE